MFLNAVNVPTLIRLIESEDDSTATSNITSNHQNYIGYFCSQLSYIIVYSPYTQYWKFLYGNIWTLKLLKFHCLRSFINAKFIIDNIVTRIKSRISTGTYELNFPPRYPCPMRHNSGSIGLRFLRRLLQQQERPCPGSYWFNQASRCTCSQHGCTAGCWS